MAIIYSILTITQSLCHCVDCHKATGSAYSTNWILPRTVFKVVSGEPKVYQATGGSGKIINSNFCGNCSTLMFNLPELVPDKVILKAGIMDDGAMHKFKPNTETFVGQKPNWLDHIEGSKLFEGGRK